MRRTLWDWFWMLPHNVRTIPCFLLDKHIGRSWFGIETIKADGDGFCSVCGTGAHAKPNFV